MPLSVAERSKRYRARHPERARAADRRAIVKRRVRGGCYMCGALAVPRRTRCLKHLAMARANVKRWRIRHPDHKRSWDPERERQQSKERYLQLVKRRFFHFRARFLRYRGKRIPVSAKALASLWKKQRGLCALSGVRLDRSANVDHILPVTRGGTSEITNLRWVSRPANLAKNDLTDEEFFVLCRQVLQKAGQL